MTLRAVLVAGALALLRPACGLELARLTQDLGGHLTGGGRDADAQDGSDEQGIPWKELHPDWKSPDDWKPPERNAHAKDDGLRRPASLYEKQVRDEARNKCDPEGIALRTGSNSTIENGVIAYLVTRRSDLEQLRESLPRLRYHLLRSWAYPVKIFVVSDSLRQYDNDTFDNLTCKKDVYQLDTGVVVGWGRIRCPPDNAPNKEEVSKVALESLGPDYDWEVADFDLKFPEVLKTRPEWEQCDRKHMKCEGQRDVARTRFEGQNDCAAYVTTGYYHMNQFFTKVMYEHEALSKYRYYLRLDADFEFRATLPKDPFCMMAQTGRKFIWQTRRHSGSEGKCSEGLWEWFQKYQQDNALTPQDPIFWREGGAWVNYVGYAGMGDLEFFRSERVRKLAEAFNKDGRVYLNRWSDQTYYVLLFALFENHTAVGDLGFEWQYSWWCHKCKKQGKFDPITGLISK